MNNIVVKFGIIGGAILVALMIGSWSLLGENSFEISEWLGYASMIVALSTIFVGVRSYRENEGGGSISFGKAFQVGLYITLIASLIYVAAWMIYYETAASDFMDLYYEHSLKELKEEGATEATIQNHMEQMEEMTELYKNPLIRIGITFIEILPVGLLITLISALILRKKPE